ncbi:hypothetical protein [Rothia kristinae]|uniref:Uncharacterized protein n=1 Tax=Rothia kristinae TaxID=37923 RepID=A0A7T3CEX9_9MICC|nr:hypothetical protein [Rothia kristinae]SIM63128.1 Uncharacterised protein [Mycobacteroides abscessus subsp. abscessus]MBG7586782.1 hypothetical protein [Rothia kristinae]MCA1169857.1 hypothetical protein [Rothia kristinae]MCT1356370.1 hypothetical protein [Rothia kristinae]MCT1392927.1 hypothetical protein [Rothia kristinae]
MDEATSHPPVLTRLQHEQTEEMIMMTRRHTVIQTALGDRRLAQQLGPAGATTVG